MVSKSLSIDSGEEGIFPEISASGDAIHVRIPEWLNTTIFETFKAVHKPAKSNRSFDNNLDSSPEEVKTYLGTYFPRSFAESFVLFDSLLSDKTLADTLSSKSRIAICSLGTGTGGDLFGTLLAIKKRISNISHIDIVSIEGNQDAHRLMRQVYEEIKEYLPPKIALIQVDYALEPPKAFEKLATTMPKNIKSFDLVISSKMLNELYSSNVSKQPYYEYCDYFTSLLEKHGVLVALDVTSKSGHDSAWTPVLLNSQINKFLRAHEGFKSILPLLCNRFETSCEDRCYTQNQVLVTHRNISNECSKICYRAICNIDFAAKLSDSPMLWACPITENNRKHCSELSNSR